MTKAERRLCDWQYNRAGSFVTALFSAISKADLHNRDRLSEAYPAEVEAYVNLTRTPGWWDNLEAEYLGQKVGVEK